MQHIDNSLFHRDDLNYQDVQEQQVAALRDFYPAGERNRMSVLDYDEVEEPLEKTRLVGPFSLDMVRWAMQCPFVTLLVDADGKEVIEY